MDGPPKGRLSYHLYVSNNFFELPIEGAVSQGLIAKDPNLTIDNLDVEEVIIIHFSLFKGNAIS
jgi:hypothetical protein